METYFEVTDSETAGNPLQQVPLFITQIRRIQRVLHPASLSGPLGQMLSKGLQNDFSDTLLAESMQ
jgi:hypothetical protein